MLIFTAFNFFSAKPNYDEMVYWLVVAAICVFIVYGRLVLKPVKPD
jgi:L-asparagine transporter-like permease